MKKPKQVLVVAYNPTTIKKLQDRLATLESMERQLTMKSGRSTHHDRRRAVQASDKRGHA